ncbi:hypothetical protein DITRI_Ditri12bG0140000 [Diplodiscus trichospermus]
MNMKGKIFGFIIFMLFAFLLCSYSTSARLLSQKQGEKEFKAEGMIQAGLLRDAKEDFSDVRFPLFSSLI